jgi:hypothetical protein
MKRINIHLTSEQIAEIKRLSEKSGLKFAELVRRAVDAFIEKERAK